MPLRDFILQHQDVLLHVRSTLYGDNNRSERTRRSHLYGSIRFDAHRPVRVQRFHAYLVLGVGLPRRNRQLAEIEKPFKRRIIRAPPVIAETISVHVSIDNVARIAAKQEPGNRSCHILPRGRARDHQPGHHVGALHRLHLIPRCIGKVHAAVNSARRLRAARIKTRERVHVVHRWDAGVGIADRDGHAGNRIGKVHHRKSLIIGAGGRRVTRDHVQVGLRPPQTNRAPQHAHQSVLNIRQLRIGSRADSVDHHQRVHDVPARGEVVGSAIDGVGEALIQVASAFAQNGVGDRSVVVVNNSNRSAYG